MDNCWPLFWLCLALVGLVLAVVAMFMNYNLKLGWRTANLEKKNGKEQHEIDELKEKVKKLEKKLESRS